MSHETGSLGWIGGDASDTTLPGTVGHAEAGLEQYIYNIRCSGSLYIIVSFHGRL